MAEQSTCYEDGGPSVQPNDASLEASAPSYTAVLRRVEESIRSVDSCLDLSEECKRLVTEARDHDPRIPWDQLRSVLPWVLSYLAVAGYVLGATFLRAYFREVLPGHPVIVSPIDTLTWTFSQLSLVFGMAVPLAASFIVSSRWHSPDALRAVSAQLV